MSVSVAQSCWVDPYKRLEALYPVPEYRGKVARFHAVGAVVGDGSGGDYIFAFNLTPVGSLGQKLLFTIDALSIFTSAVIAGLAGYVTIQSGEQSTTGQLYNRFFASMGANGYSAVPNTLYGGTYKIGGLQSAVFIQMTPNTNTVQMTCMVLGHLWDEQFMR